MRDCKGVDQAVPPLSHIRGGTHEGNARWSAFRRDGLDQYANRRNNAMLRCGQGDPCSCWSANRVLPIWHTLR